MPIIGTVILEMMLGMAMRNISLFIPIFNDKDKNILIYLGIKVIDNDFLTFVAGVLSLNSRKIAYLCGCNFL